MAQVDDPRLSPESKLLHRFHFIEKHAMQRKLYRRSITTPSRTHTHSSADTNSNEPGPNNHGDNQSSSEAFSLKQVLIWLAAYLGVGTFFFFLVGDQLKGDKTIGFLDALYFCVVTMTTVGYGDLVPNSTLSKLLASVYVLTGMALGALILSKAADYVLEKQEKLLVRALCGDENGEAEVAREIVTLKGKYKFITASIQVLVLAVLGIAFFILVEKLSFVDSLYCVCATMTTLGYGDLSFSDGIGRLFGVFWILASTICMAQVVLYLAELYTEDRQRGLADWVLSRQLTSSDLEAADLDNDNEVSAAEFVLFKLQEMGKITQEDVTLVMQRFKNLDVDQSGTLTTSDLRAMKAS